MRWLCVLVISSVVGCQEPSSAPAPHVFVGLDRIEAAFREGHAYEDLVAAIEEARHMRGADDAAYGIAESRFTFTLVYERPGAEVEAALRERLAVDDDPVGRLRATGAAYAAYPELAPYFHHAVAEVEAMPTTPVITRALEAAARVRARVEEK